eukprot:1082032-Pelagomonas_calceolata.AAC.4
MQEKPLPAGFDEGCRHIRVVHTTSNGASRVHAFMHSPHERHPYKVVHCGWLCHVPSGQAEVRGCTHEALVPSRHTRGLSFLGTAAAPQLPKHVDDLGCIIVPARKDIFWEEIDERMRKASRWESCLRNSHTSTTAAIRGKEAPAYATGMQSMLISPQVLTFSFPFLAGWLSIFIGAVMTRPEFPGPVWPITAAPCLSSEVLAVFSAW